MTGYSGTPLPRKLGIKSGHRVAILSAPDALRGTLGERAEGVKVRTRLPVRRGGSKANAAAPRGLDVILAFVKRRAELERRLARFMDALDPDGGLWIAWPKRASGVATDLTEDIVREVGVAAGMVDNKVCAIDETWSGLRLVWRVADRDAVRAARARERS